MAGETEVLRENGLKRPFPPQISHDLTWDRIRASGGSSHVKFNRISSINEMTDT
jgi:hypothetical protein